MEMLLGNATNLEKSLVSRRARKKSEMKEEKTPTSQKAKSDPAQGVQVTIRALTVNTSNGLKDKLRSSVKQCDFKRTGLPVPC